MALRMLRPTLATLDTRAAKPAPKIADPFYQSAAWRELVDKIKAERGARCEAPGCGRRAHGSTSSTIGQRSTATAARRDQVEAQGKRQSGLIPSKWRNSAMGGGGSIQFLGFGGPDRWGVAYALRPEIKVAPSKSSCVQRNKILKYL